MYLNYEEFIDEVARGVRKEVSVTTDVTVCKTRKNNGVIKRGITISSHPQMAAPTIYLEEFYEKYKSQGALDEMVGEILDVYRNAKCKTPEISKVLENFESLSSKVVFRLVNWEFNQDLLENVPHMRFLDLVILFYVVIDVNSFSNASMLVTNEHLDIWETDLETLFELARKNTQKLLGFSFVPMESVLSAPVDLSHFREETMYVLSNNDRSYGASVMIYYNKLVEIADYMGENFYIMPSSVHELILLRESYALPEPHMLEMVRVINEEDVPEEEILSNSIYYFDADMKKVITIS